MLKTATEATAIRPGNAAELPVDEERNERAADDAVDPPPFEAPHADRGACVDEAAYRERHHALRDPRRVRDVERVLLSVPERDPDEAPCPADQ